MLKKIETFLRDTSGAITVDWVVLTAALVGLGFAVTLSISQGTQQVTANITTEVNEVAVNNQQD